MKLSGLVAGFTVLAALAQPASALTFNLTQITNDSLTDAQLAAFKVAASVWSSSLSDNITVNIQIGFANLGAGILGGASPTLVFRSGVAYKAAMLSDAKDATDGLAVSSLSTSNQASIALTTADSKALGLSAANDTASDGRIEFSTNYTFSNTRNADGTIAAGTYDLIGIAEHEIGHILGFVSSIDNTGSTVQTALDQFRYSGAGTRSVSAGAAAYFSIDGGTTDLANFSVGGSGNNQASHWAIGTNGVMVPEVAAGQTQNITPLDLVAFDTIGYDLVAVPEPASLALLGGALLGTIRLRRRRG